MEIDLTYLYHVSMYNRGEWTCVGVFHQAYLAAKWKRKRPLLETLLQYFGWLLSLSLGSIVFVEKKESVLEQLECVTFHLGVHRTFLNIFFLKKVYHGFVLGFFLIVFPVKSMKAELLFYRSLFCVFGSIFFVTFVPFDLNQLPS